MSWLVFFSSFPAMTDEQNESRSSNHPLRVKVAGEGGGVHEWQIRAGEGISREGGGGVASDKTPRQHRLWVTCGPERSG